MRKLGLLTIAAALPLIAQPAIQTNGILNAASQASPIFKHGLIAPGMRVLILGTGLGPDTPVQAPASYPLPTQQGLGGVTVRIRLVGTPNFDDCIVLYASATKVGIILPNTAGVGNAELALTYKDATATVPIKTAQHAPGLFTLNAYGSGPAVAVNSYGASGTKPNTLFESATPGQTIALLGTGLGAANGNEALRPAPGAFSPVPEVWIGRMQAKVIYAGRNQNVSGYDEFDVQVPPNVTPGCYVSVQVRQDDVASNTATIAVTPNGGPCDDALLSPVAANDSLAVGRITLLRTLLKVPQQDGSVTDSYDETFTASFSGYNTDKFLRAVPDQPSPGSCMTSFTPDGLPNPSPNGDPLNAGPMLTILNPSDSRTVSRGDRNYSAEIGGGQSGIPLFLDQGPFTVSNGDGGVVGAFQAQTDVQPAFTWNEAGKMSLSNPLTKVEVTWSGGDPAGQVAIVGAVVGADGKTGGGFICTEVNSAGRFSVPDVVLSDMPVNAQGLAAMVLLIASYANPAAFDAPGLDQATITHISSIAGVGLFKRVAPTVPVKQ